MIFIHLKKLCFVFACGFLLAVSKPAWALDLGFAQEDAGQAGTFLEFAGSARSLGMGRTHVGVSDDASALYWNPAGLAQLKRKDLVTLYSDLFEDSSFGTILFAQPAARIGAFGMGVVTLRSGNFDKRGESGEDLGSFKVNDTAFLFGHGFKINHKWLVGSGLKGIRQEIDNHSGTSVGFDAGAMYLWKPRLKFGLNLRNLIQPKVKLDTQEDKFPRDIRLGIMGQPWKTLSVAVDLSRAEDRGLKILTGVEWLPIPTLALRAGINESEMTAGIGINLGDFSLDYALGYNDAAPGIEDLGRSHRFGFHVKFGRDVASEEMALLNQKEGQVILSELRRIMDKQGPIVLSQLKAVLEKAQRAIVDNAYPIPGDLMETQGYVNYLQGEFDRAVHYLSEALALKTKGSEDLEKRYRVALEQLNEEQKRKMIASEFESGQISLARKNYHEAIKSFEKILRLDPHHEMAQTRLKVAQHLLFDPVRKALKIANEKFATKEYLAAIRYSQKVRALDPENKEAEKIMARSLSALENSFEMEKPIVQVQEITPNSQESREFYSRGLQLYSKGNLKDALTAWRQAMELDSDNRAAQNAYKRALLELDEEK